MKSRKRLLSLFLSLAVMLTMCVTTAAAMDADNGSAATITVETVKQAVKVDDEVTLNVSIANNPGFVVFDFTIQYDKEKLELQGIENGSFEGSLLGNTAAGKVNFTGDVQQECTEDGTLFILKFKVKADCSNGTQVGLKATTFKNANNATILPTIVSGGMTSGSTTGGSTTGGSTTGGSTTGGSTTGGSTTGGSTTGGSTTGGSTTGGSTTGGSTTGGSTTGGSTTGGSTTGGSTTGGSTTGGSTTGGSTTGGSTTGGSTTGGSTTGGSTTGGSTTGGSTTGGSTTGGSTTGGSTTGGSTTGGSTTGGSTTGGSSTGSDRKVELVGKSNGATYIITGNTLNVQNDAACVVLWTDDGGETYTKLAASKNEAGGYDFDLSNVPTNVVIKIAIKGDANGDGRVNSADGVFLDRSLLEEGHSMFKALDALQKIILDLNGDGKVNTADGVLLDRSLLEVTHNMYRTLTW